MKRYPIILSIDGSASTGGDGIQSDIKIISALGAYAATVITSIRVENTLGIKDNFILPEDIIKSQIELIMEDMLPEVVKIGQINSVKAVNIIADCIRKYHPQYVLYDPVFQLYDGLNVVDADTINIIKEKLFPYTNLITINMPEMEILTNMKLRTKDDLKNATRIIAEKYRIPILGKGYPLLEDDIYDILYVPDGDNWEYIGTKFKTEYIHGASSSLSAAIATYLALGEKLNVAIKLACEYVQEAIKIGKDVYVGHGNGPICHNWNPVKMRIYGE